MELNHLLRQKRLERGLTQSHLAKKLGMAQAHVARYESVKETITPSMGTLERFAKALEFPVSDFLEASAISELASRENVTKNRRLEKLIKQFQVLPDEKQKVILDLIKDMSK